MKINGNHHSRATLSEPLPNLSRQTRARANPTQAAANWVRFAEPREARGPAADVLEQPFASQEETTRYFTAISRQFGGDQGAIQTSVTIMEAVQREADPERRLVVLLQHLALAGSWVVAQMVACGLASRGFGTASMHAQGVANRLLLRLLAAPLRWLGVVGG